MVLMSTKSVNSETSGFFTVGSTFELGFLCAKRKDSN